MLGFLYSCRRCRYLSTSNIAVCLTCSLFSSPASSSLIEPRLRNGRLHHILDASPVGMHTSLLPSRSTSRWHRLTTSAGTTLSPPVSSRTPSVCQLSLPTEILCSRVSSPTLVTPPHLTSPHLHHRVFKVAWVFKVVWVFKVFISGLQGSRVFKVVVIFISSSLWCNE